METVHYQNYKLTLVNKNGANIAQKIFNFHENDEYIEFETCIIDSPTDLTRGWVGDLIYESYGADYNTFDIHTNDAFTFENDGPEIFKQTYKDVLLLRVTVSHELEEATVFKYKFIKY